LASYISNSNGDGLIELRNDINTYLYILFLNLLVNL
jgi:hypothetical protein